ncbi:MAG TPA: tRNA lysidine(34) synthetase TilS [Methylophilus sp.]|uniref:tRNA lysidine(34) synthetase TilS n=1 Tax=Methylophilus sp. TaxID=29541 RepID=UPI002C9EA231|nr:tRNA lysidine(34) synthetase TilS [Methylophilus sp.]HSH86819.1 tRNA lysidine(34) synthetase TilS [Methylophilus sp.]
MTNNAASLVSAKLEKSIASFLAAQKNHTSPSHLLLALSGGVDSIVLLHTLAKLSSQLPFTLSAMHIHHGLSPHADDWLSLCERVCREIDIPFYAEKVHVDSRSGLGVEATAREARYEALKRQRQQLAAHAIVTAHHVQDQSETLLLQLVRGAGVKGLSAMSAWDADRFLLRPLLQVKKADILQLANALHCKWVEDESNTDTRYDRNFMRHTAMPVLRERYPQLDSALSRSANHMAEAQILLDALASQDICACDVRDEWLGQSVDIQRLRLLGDVRAKNMLRYWFQQLDLRMPNTEQLQDYWQQLSSVKPHRYLHLPLHGQAGKRLAYLHHYQQRLYCAGKPTALPKTPLVWQGGKSQIWGDWQVHFKVSKGRGIALARLGVNPAAITLHRRYGQAMPKLENLEVMLLPRAGGETLQPDTKRPRRELKVIFQMLAIPPWQRAFYPIVHVASAGSDSPTLVSLASLAVDAAWQPGRNAYGLEISLLPLSTS